MPQHTFTMSDFYRFRGEKNNTRISQNNLFKKQSNYFPDMSGTISAAFACKILDRIGCWSFGVNTHFVVPLWPISYSIRRHKQYMFQLRFIRLHNTIDWAHTTTTIINASNNTIHRTLQTTHYHSVQTWLHTTHYHTIPCPLYSMHCTPHICCSRPYKSLFHVHTTNYAMYSTHCILRTVYYTIYTTHDID